MTNAFEAKAFQLAGTLRLLSARTGDGAGRRRPVGTSGEHGWGEALGLCRLAGNPRGGRNLKPDSAHSSLIIYRMLSIKRISPKPNLIVRME
jgi:hypothetical protein